MATKKAETLTQKRLKLLLEDVMVTNKQPEVMKAAFMLSYYAGLRVQEIAGLDWRLNVLNTDGTFKSKAFPVFDVDGEPVVDSQGREVMEMVNCLFIGSNIGKYGTERSIPLHPDLETCLRELFDFLRGEEAWPVEPHVIPSGKNGASQALTRRAHALKMRINRIYKALGLEGCSTHSGRRTFITRGAQKANTVGNSLKDVQVLSGHKNLVTTQGYIDESNKHARLVNSMWS